MESKEEFMSKLWTACLDCGSESCCNLPLVYPLFVTHEEMEHIEEVCPDRAKSFNRGHPCPFVTEEGLCMIHTDKPVDCRLFPFDVMKVDGKLYWVIWETGCPISKEEWRYSEYLEDMEEKLIPGFSPHLEAYALFRNDELHSKYTFRILREVNIRMVSSVL